MLDKTILKEYVGMVKRNIKGLSREQLHPLDRAAQDEIIRRALRK